MRTRRTGTDKPRRGKPLAGIPALLPRVRTGELSADAFLRATSADFERMAVALLRGFHVPSAVDALDVAQELRIYCLRALPKWDAERGCDLATFCMFKAHSDAIEWINRQRGVGKDANRRVASRMPLLLIDAVEREERESLLAEALWCAAPPLPADEATDASRRERLARALAAALGETVEDLSRAVEKWPDVRDGVRRMIETGMIEGA